MQYTVNITSQTPASRHVRSLLALLGALIFGSPLASQSVIPLTRGACLVATSNLDGTSFEKTVILIASHDDNETTGITINRPTGKPLSTFFPHFKKYRTEAPLFLGGPVHPLTLVVLAQTESRDGWSQVMDDVYIGGGNAAIRELQHSLHDGRHGEIRAFAGYAGWAPGQLENEIQRGDWLVIKADKNLIFSEDPSHSWDVLYKEWSGKWL